MSLGSSSPPAEPGSSASSTLPSFSSATPVPVESPEPLASLDDLLKSSGNPTLQARQPSSTLPGAPSEDQRRRNGFHLWRTESEDARKARLRRAFEAAELHANAPRTVSDQLRNKLASFANWLSSHRFVSLYRRSSIHLDEEEDGVATQPFLLREQKLTTLGLMILTLSLAGAQLAWTLELAYGTPYLLSLGLSEQSTSLVWLAGPLSGLIAQPVVGSLSDHSTSAFRRRKYMIISATLLTISTITLAYAVPISTALVDLFGGGLADWDPHRHRLVHSTTQAISVIAFWILDFALNGLQAASRALILDTAPSEQQSIANAWQGRMTHAGNVLGYLCGWLDLASWKGLRWLGGGQFRRFAMISLLAMISCVSVTITCISESPTEHSFAHHNRRQSPCTSTWRKIEKTFNDVWHAIRTLPRSVRRVCLVQLFAFMGWFPFLFYSTTYILQMAQYERNIKRQQKPHNAFGPGSSPYYQDGPRIGDENGGSDGSASLPNSDRDAERGSFAMLLFAVVSLIAGALLPYLALAGERRDKESPNQDVQDDEPLTPPLALSIPIDQEPLPSHDPEHEEKISRAKRIARGLTKGLTLRTFWTLASLTFATLMLIGTAWASTVNQATIVIALVGVPWSIAAWAPFAMVGEFVREAEDGASPFEFEDDHWSPSRTRARANLRWLKKQRRESVRQSASRLDDDGGSAAAGQFTSPNGSGSVVESRAGFKYIEPETSPTRRQTQLYSKSEQEARERIRRSLVDCARLPQTLTADQSHEDHGEGQGGESGYIGSDDGLEYTPDFASGTGGASGAGTILGIHNLAIVAPQFVVAIIASLIFSAVHASHGGIHLVLGQQPFALVAASAANNPAEGTVWVLRFGGSMAILAALATRFVPLTLSERQRRYARASQQRRHLEEADEQTRNVTD